MSNSNLDVFITAALLNTKIFLQIINTTEKPTDKLYITCMYTASRNCCVKFHYLNDEPQFSGACQ